MSGAFPPICLLAMGKENLKFISASVVCGLRFEFNTPRYKEVFAYYLSIVFVLTAGIKE
jgi:hypothetical protein